MGLRSPSWGRPPDVWRALTRKGLPLACWDAELDTAQAPDLDAPLLCMNVALGRRIETRPQPSSC
jgi:hypothetical protein